MMRTNPERLTAYVATAAGRFLTLLLLLSASSTLAFGQTLDADELREASDSASDVSIEADQIERGVLEVADSA